MTVRAIAAAVSLVVPLCALAQGSSKQIPARTEIHSIPSLTISDEQFLKGDSAGKPVVVSGVLRIAQGAGRLPAVVLIHGSGGMGANIDFWSRELNAMGISTFALDGFTGRGLASVNTDQAQLGRLNMIVDAYGMLDVLAKHPRVDASRIESLIELVDFLPEQIFGRTGVHSEAGPIRAWDVVGKAATHNMHHYGQLVAIREGQPWPPPSAAE